MSCYLITVFITFLWGLWFLQFPGGPKNRIGLKVKYILLILVLALIPIVNVILFILFAIALFQMINEEGWDEVFPTTKKYTKLKRFFNHQFFK